MALDWKSLRGKPAWLVILVGLAATSEGLYTYVYRDPVGVPTYCYGETENVPPSNTRFTPAECQDILVNKLPRYDAEIGRCIPGWDKANPNLRAAIDDLAYNEGSGAVCKSTLVRKLKAGDIRGACAEFKRWIYAGGRILPGLVTRRAKETDLCLLSLQQ